MIGTALGMSRAAGATLPATVPRTPHCAPAAGPTAPLGVTPMVVAAQDGANGGIQWSAALRAGLIAGMSYIGVEMFLTPLFLGDSGLLPLQRIAAIVLGARALAPPHDVTVETLLTGIGVHLVLSLLFASLIAAVIHRSEPAAGVMLGAMAGLVLYTANYYAFTTAFPWFVSGRTWVTVFAHLVFGVVGAWIYKTVQPRANLSSGPR